MKKERLQCCLCGATIDYTHSNNALPLKEGRCCDRCNWEKVIPARLQALQENYKN